MSASIVEQLTAMLSGVTAPKEQKVLAVGSAIELVRLLNSKQCDLADTLPTVDGRAVTYKEILGSRTENVTRRNGTVGTDYLLTHELAHEPASAAITALKALPKKADSGFAGKKNNSQPKAENGLTQELLLAAILKLVENQAAPQPAEGHTVQPASPVEEIAEEVAIDVTIGDVVRIRRADGSTVLRQLVETASGLRLNATIV